MWPLPFPGPCPHCHCHCQPGLGFWVEQQHYGINHHHLSLCCRRRRLRLSSKGCSKADGLTPAVNPPSFTLHISNCIPTLIFKYWPSTYNRFTGISPSRRNGPQSPNPHRNSRRSTRSTVILNPSDAQHALSYLHHIPTCLDISAV